MGTLELVPLRSKFPYTGHMTVRYESPMIHPEGAIDADELQDILDSLETITTPQVAAVPAGETAVRKGVQAR
jgi:hypothetical protein